MLIQGGSSSTRDSKSVSKGQRGRSLWRSRVQKEGRESGLVYCGLEIGVHLNCNRKALGVVGRALWGDTVRRKGRPRDDAGRRIG